MESTPETMTITTYSTDETIQLGWRLGRACQGGECFAITGQLGAGKTHLIKGIAQGLLIDPHQVVNSPTFTLINEYEGRLPLIHVDAWRLEGAAQLEALGFDEYVTVPTVTVVEWADRVHSLIDEFEPITVTIEHLGEQSRRIHLAGLPGTSDFSAIASAAAESE